MRTVFLFALFLTGTLVAASDVCPKRPARQTTLGRARYSPVSIYRKPRTGPAVVAMAPTLRVTRTTIHLSKPSSALPAVAAPPLAPQGTVVEGVLPRLVQSPNALEMFNPLAPPEYGSARNFVVYTERDPYNTATNKFRFQPDGIRLLTVRPLW